MFSNLLKFSVPVLTRGLTTFNITSKTDKVLTAGCVAFLERMHDSTKLMHSEMLDYRKDKKTYFDANSSFSPRSEDFISSDVDNNEDQELPINDTTDGSISKEANKKSDHEALVHIFHVYMQLISKIIILQFIY